MVKRNGPNNTFISCTQPKSTDNAFRTRIIVASSVFFHNSTSPFNSKLKTCSFWAYSSLSNFLQHSARLESHQRMLPSQWIRWFCGCPQQKSCTAQLLGTSLSRTLKSHIQTEQQSSTPRKINPWWVHNVDLYFRSRSKYFTLLAKWSRGWSIWIYF